jgi:hypothetical protein
MSTFTDAVISTVALEVITPSDSRPDFSTQGAINTFISNSQFITSTATIAAAGTTISTATAITTPTVVVTTAASTAGVVLPVGVLGVEYTIVNTSGTNTLNVYATSSTINGVSGSTAVVVPVNGILFAFGSGAGTYAAK